MILHSSKPKEGAATWLQEKEGAMYSELHLKNNDFIMKQVISYLRLA